MITAMITAAIWTAAGGLFFFGSVFADYKEHLKIYRLLVSVGGFWVAAGVLTALLIMIIDRGV